MSAHPATSSILPSRFTQLPDPGGDLIADAEEELAADAARVLAEAEAHSTVGLGEELELDGLKLDTGEAEERLEDDDNRAGPGATDDGHAAVEGGPEAEVGVEPAQASAELGGELLLGRQAGDGEAPESDELEAEELEFDEEFFDGEVESALAVPENEPASDESISGVTGRYKRRGSPRLRAAAAGAQFEAGKPLPGEAASNARFFFRAVNLGKMSVEEARRSIGVCQHEKANLLLFAKLDPGDAQMVIRYLALRHRAMAEFERLLALQARCSSPATEPASDAESARGDSRGGSTIIPQGGEGTTNGGRQSQPRAESEKNTQDRVPTTL